MEICSTLFDSLGVRNLEFMQDSKGQVYLIVQARLSKEASDLYLKCDRKCLGCITQKKFSDVLRIEFDGTYGSVYHDNRN